MRYTTFSCLTGVLCALYLSSGVALSSPSRFSEAAGGTNAPELRRRSLPVQPVLGTRASRTRLRQLPLDGEKSDALTVSGGAQDNTPAQSTVFRGRLLLIFVSFLFGSLNVALKMLYALPGAPKASALSFYRGVLAAMCFLPVVFMPKSESQAQTQTEPGKVGRSMALAAFELAFWNFGAQGLLNVGLLKTEAARASFLTQTSVVITPLLSLAAGYSVNRSLWVGCVAALVGLAMLGGGGAVATTAASFSVGGLVQKALSLFRFSVGDFLVLGGAVSWSMYIFRLSTVSDRYPEVPFQALKTTLLACLYGTWYGSAAVTAFCGSGMEGVVSLWPGWKSLTAWGILLYSAIGPGALADVLQQIGQTSVSAAEANVILCAEPVFTALCARVLLGEMTSGRDKLGGGLIILAALIASGVFDRKRTNKKD